MLFILLPFLAAFLYSMCDFTENFIVDTWCKKLRPQCLKIAYLGMDAAGLLALLIWRGSSLFYGLG